MPKSDYSAQSLGYGHRAGALFAEQRGSEMRVLVLGGDGFCGWPTSLYLSGHGHDVTILDNLSRRKIDVDLEVGSLTPITPIGDRLLVWREVSGREIGLPRLITIRRRSSRTHSPHRCDHRQ